MPIDQAEDQITTTLRLVRLGYDDLAWRQLAACQDKDTTMFFPVGHTQKARRLERMAKLICANCPVRTECLEFALGTMQNDGVWGGLNEDDRRSLRRQRRALLRRERTPPSTATQSA